jgi:hypothetical protein
VKLGSASASTMRLSDARLHCRPTKLIYPDHRPPPWPTKGATTRSLEPIVRMHRPEPVATQAISKNRAAIQNRAISYLREESIYVSGSTECTRDAQLKCPFEKSIQDRFATGIRLGKEDHFAVVRNVTLFTISKVHNF